MLVLAKRPIVTLDDPKLGTNRQSGPLAFLGALALCQRCVL